MTTTESTGSQSQPTSVDVNTILQGDCLKTLKTISDNSIDQVVTDPPYGYSFMNKDWDKAVPSVDVWKECLRVLKPGAFCFVMSAPRQDVLSQMIVRLHEAGFDTDFSSIYWTYSSGFPKASNIGKMIDKQKGAKRKVVGKKSGERYKYDFNSGALGGNIGLGDAGSITEPSTEEAKQFDGSYGGFQPKPAVEVILVCMKPLTEKTFVAQALKNGHGVTWLDDCRIPYASSNDREKARVGYDNDDISTNPLHATNSKGGFGIKEAKDYSVDKGRFPANLLVSDDVLNDGREIKVVGGMRKKKSNTNDITHIGWKDNDYQISQSTTPGDSGSYSRYFNLDAWDEKAKSVFPFIICTKASKKEKNNGCEGLEDKEVSSTSKLNPIKCPVCNKWLQTAGDGCKCETKQLTDGIRSKLKNNHPTVKPLKLMRYLITLASRPGEIVLDPFSGSGSTLVAAQQLTRRYIGCELNKEYIEIAEARLQHDEEQTNTETIKAHKGKGCKGDNEVINEFFV